MEDIEETHALTNEYEKKVRPLIDVIDELRDIGLDKDINLPAVAVVGDQSAGKSSVLEAISGITLPKSNGMVTRCPLIVRMQKTSLDPSFSISYKKDDTSHSSTIGKNDIADEIKLSQNQLAGTDKNISHEPITLEIKSSDVPDLTLIDLPGLIKNPLPTQPENIGQQIENLIEEVLSKQETIILAVVPANMDIATTDALRIARKHDPNGERTIGVITKPDLIDKGTEIQLIDTINNKVVPLKKGYIAVKCRSQQMVTDNVAIHEGQKQEEEFFAESEHFRHVKGNKLGIKNLCSKLTEELVQHIKHSIPNIKKQVFEKKYATTTNLKELGKGVPEDRAHKIILLSELVNKFNKDIEEVLEGNNHSGKVTAEYELYNVARKNFKEFYDNLVERIPEFGNNLFRRIKEDIDKYRSNQLPGFSSYWIVRNLITEITETYKEPAHDCLHELNAIVGITIGKIIICNFGTFPGVVDFVKHSTKKRRQSSYDVCKERIDEVFEMEGLVFTQDRLYKYDLSVVEKAEEDNLEEMRNEDVNILALDNIPDHRITNFRGHNESDSTATDKEAAMMYNALKSYLEVAARRLVDIIPTTIILHLFKKLSKQICIDATSMVAQEEALQMIRENDEIAVKRRKLSSKMHRLEEAEFKLSNIA